MTKPLRHVEKSTINLHLWVCKHRVQCVWVCAYQRVRLSTWCHPVRCSWCQLRNLAGVGLCWATRGRTPRGERSNRRSLCGSHHTPCSPDSTEPPPKEESTEGEQGLVLVFPTQELTDSQLLSHRNCRPKDCLHYASPLADLHITSRIAWVTNTSKHTYTPIMRHTQMFHNARDGRRLSVTQLYLACQILLVHILAGACANVFLQRLSLDATVAASYDGWAVNRG